MKGSEFSGLVFVKFPTTEDRDAGIRILRDAKHKPTGSKLWTKPDLPLHDRIVRNVLFGTKHLMTSSWEWSKSDIWVDEASNSVFILGEKTFSVHIADHELKVAYFGEWQGYLNDAAHPQFTELLHSASSKLAKGRGKGKSKAKEAAASTQ